MFGVRTVPQLIEYRIAICFPRLTSI